MKTNEPNHSRDDYKLMIDNERYVWNRSEITGSELRVLGAVPDGVQVWKKNHGRPDSIVELATIIDLSHEGTEKFSLQEASSGAGSN
jgi:hypothetical protein